MKKKERVAAAGCFHAISRGERENGVLFEKYLLSKRDPPLQWRKMIKDEEK